MLDAYRRILSLLPGAYLVAAADGRVQVLNERAARLLDLQRSPGPLPSLAELCDCSSEALASALRQFARGTTPVPAILRFRTPTGVAELRINGALLAPASAGQPALLLLHLVERGNASDRFIALNQRIDELNHEISRRKRTEREVAEQREWLHVTLSSIGDGVIATDRDGAVLFQNKVAADLTGWSQAEALGRPLAEVFRIADEYTLEPMESPVGRVLREGAVVGLANHTVLLTRDGRAVPIADSAAPIIGEDGSVVGVVLVFHDVSERAAMEMELRRQGQALIEADRRKNEFLAMLAHELRNPLAPMRNAATLLESGKCDAAMLQRMGQMMVRQIGLLTRMVDDLLDVARITRGKIELRPAPTSLHEVVERALETSRPALERHELVVETPGEDVPMLADLARMAQAVSNVLLNAGKFTPPGGRIVLHAGCADGLARVAVHDQGMGMSPELLATVFELFTQGEQPLDRSQGGLGIGLTLVRTILELHGGAVHAYSDGPGSGSSFTMEWPVRSPVRAPAAGAAAARSPQGHRVLVVDDNRDAAETLAALLQMWGHEVRIAESGQAAIEELDRFDAELALVDIGMPGMDGYALARKIRERGRPHPLLAAVTGYGTDEARLRALEAGFDVHLTKPVGPERLQSLVARLQAAP